MRAPVYYVKENHITAATVHTASYNTPFAEQSKGVEVLQKRTLRNGKTKPLANPIQMSATDKSVAAAVAKMKRVLSCIQSECST